MEFKIILKQLLDDNNITQTTLAKELGFTPQAVSRWCNGDTEPDTKMLKKIANYFDVSVDYLLGNISIKNDNEQKEIEALERLLIKKGFMKKNEDLTNEELEKLINFVVTNKEFLKENDK